MGTVNQNKINNIDINDHRNSIGIEDESDTASAFSLSFLNWFGDWQVDWRFSVDSRFCGKIPWNSQLTEDIKICNKLQSSFCYIDIGDGRWWQFWQHISCPYYKPSPKNRHQNRISSGLEFDLRDRRKHSHCCSYTLVFDQTASSFVDIE